jgi:cyanophycin synthetase
VVFDAHELAPALAFLERSEGPVVAKPAGSTGGGAGVAGSVTTGDDLARVCLASARWTRRLLLEQTIEGREYRLLFLDGELLGAVERHRPRLRGDGRASIAELVVRENLRRVGDPDGRYLRAIRMDLDLELTLRRQGATLGTVLPDEVSIELKTAVSENAPDENETAVDLAPAVVADSARAARAVYLRLAGVDIVTPDPSRGLAEAGGAVLEVNSPPGLHYHYLVAEPERAVVAVPILERLLDEARP